MLLATRAIACRERRHRPVKRQIPYLCGSEILTVQLGFVVYTQFGEKGRERWMQELSKRWVRVLWTLYIFPCERQTIWKSAKGDRLFSLAYRGWESSEFFICIAKASVKTETETGTSYLCSRTTVVDPMTHRGMEKLQWDCSQLGFTVYA